MRSRDGDRGKHELLRSLPQVGALLQAQAVSGLLAEHPREVVKDALREALDEARGDLLSGRREDAPSVEAVVDRAAELLARAAAPSLRPVINATGVVIHTGLGRAPLAAAAVEALRAAGGYCNLEVRLDAAERGRRDEHVAELLCRVTGAEAATVVNNNAGAILLVLAELARGRKVVVSRGQLIEIGGSFRLPDIMAQSGCMLVEVGTTNRTHLPDYERALDDDTAALLVAHHSNYRIVGFQAEPDLKDLAELAHRHGLLLLHDLGSGALVDLGRFGVAREPMAQDSLAAGADIVCFSTDKMLGGPQGGAILGRTDLIARLRRNPLARALRVDKLCLAALEATLRLYLDEITALAQVPVLSALAEPVSQVRARAERAYADLAGLAPTGLSVRVEDDVARVGGGSLPEEDLPSTVVKLRPREGLGVEELARRLRVGEPSVYPRIADDAVVLDFRTVRDDEIGGLVQAVAAALARRPGDAAAPQSE